MATQYRLYEILANTEASFLQNASSPVSNTYDTRIPIRSATLTVDQPRDSDQTIQSRKNESRPGPLGLRTASIEFETDVPGIMSDPGVGAPAANWFYTLLSDGLGGALATDDGGTISSATDADTFVTTGVTTITPGSVIFVGAPGDGRAVGQPGVVDTWSAGSTQLLTALPGTPAAADAVRTSLHMYPTETTPTVTRRFLCGHKDTGAQWHLMGAQLDRVTFSHDIQAGAPPRATWRYLAAYWDTASFTIPSAVAMPASDTAVIGASGSMFVQTTGTVTRALEQPTTMSLTLDMGLIPVQGPSPNLPTYTNIYGWESRGCVPTLTYSIPWTAQKATDFDSDMSNTVHKQVLFVTNSLVGRRSGFYLPRAYPVGSKPSRVDRNGLLYTEVVYKGRESTITTSELTRSCVRFFLG